MKAVTFFSLSSEKQKQFKKSLGFRFRSTMGVKRTVLSSQQIIEIIECQYGYNMYELSEKNRHVSLVGGRHLYYYLFKKHHTHLMSLQSIGSRFNQNHATVLHGIKRVEDAIKFPFSEVDKKLKEIVEKI